jgi:hypothetical protein
MQADETSPMKTTFHSDPPDPNYPETSGTTLPLLSAVLAGFAVTTIVQLMLRPGDEDLSPMEVMAITAFLVGVICFLSSIVFSHQGAGQSAGTIDGAVMHHLKRWSESSHSAGQRLSQAGPRYPRDRASNGIFSLNYPS